MQQTGRKRSPFLTVMSLQNIYNKMKCLQNILPKRRYFWTAVNRERCSLQSDGVVMKSTAREKRDQANISFTLTCKHSSVVRRRADINACPAFSHWSWIRLPRSNRIHEQQWQEAQTLSAELCSHTSAVKKWGSICKYVLLWGVLLVLKKSTFRQAFKLPQQ